MRFLLALVCLWAGFAHAGGLIATVEHDADSVILRLPLIDEDGTQCPSADIAGTESGLEVWVQADVESSATKLTAAGSDLDAITTIGTYETPTAGEARWEVVEAGSCVYELHLEDARFGVANANVLNITVMDTNGSAGFLEDSFWVDLTAVGQSTLVDAIWDEPMSGHTTAGSAGEQLGTDVDAILVDTGTTLADQLSTLLQQTEFVHLRRGTINTVTSQTQLIPAGDNPNADDVDIGNLFCVTDTGASPEIVECAPIEDYAQASGTYTIEAGHISFTIATSDEFHIREAGSNVMGINDTDIKGVGTSGNPWGPDD